MFNLSVVQGENLFVLTSLMIVEKLINEFIRVYTNNFTQNLYQNSFLLQEITMFSADPVY